MQQRTEPDFGYSWLWQYWHLIPMTAFGLAAAVSFTLGWPGWLTIIFAALAAWALAGFGVMFFKMRANTLMPMPTSAYLPDGGRVLDVGCGSGRTSIMVCQARPTCEVVGLDNFSANYIAGHGADNTRANLQAVGVDDRVTIQEGDMREMPFEDQGFDGVVSSYAIDHLKPAEIPGVLQEVNRVLGDGGQFLLMVIVPNLRTMLSWGPLILLGFCRRGFWRATFEQTGFTLEEEGDAGATAYFLVRKTGKIR